LPWLWYGYVVAAKHCNNIRHSGTVYRFHLDTHQCQRKIFPHISWFVFITKLLINKFMPSPFFPHLPCLKNRVLT
jgi:hypothetical protein